MKNLKCLLLLLLASSMAMAQTHVPPATIKGPNDAGTTNSVQTYGYQVKQSNKKSSASLITTVADSMSTYLATDSAGNAYLWNYAGHFGIIDTGDTYNRNASALLQLISTTSGFLLPKMTAAQRAAIVSPTAGLHVYQTDGQPGDYIYNGSAWGLAGSGSGTVSATTGITTGTTQTQAGATALTTVYNNIGTNATAGNGVRLPTAVLGSKVIVHNSTILNAAVYPATGAAIDAVAADASVILAPGQEMVFEATTATQWLTREPATLAVSQGTNISTTVVCSNRKGLITTQAANAGAAGATPNTFSVTNTQVTSTSNINAWICNYSGTIATNGNPFVIVDNRSAGSFDIIISNAHGANAVSGTLVIGFEVLN